MGYRKSFMAAVCERCVENGIKAGWTRITDLTLIDRWIEAGRPYDVSEASSQVSDLFAG
jgi:hypothetical protein